MSIKAEQQTNIESKRKVRRECSVRLVQREAFYCCKTKGQHVTLHNAEAGRRRMAASAAQKGKQHESGSAEKSREVRKRSGRLWRGRQHSGRSRGRRAEVCKMESGSLRTVFCGPLRGLLRAGTAVERQIGPITAKYTHSSRVPPIIDHAQNPPKTKRYDPRPPSKILTCTQGTEPHSETPRRNSPSSRPHPPLTASSPPQLHLGPLPVPY